MVYCFDYYLVDSLLDGSVRCFVEGVVLVWNVGFTVCGLLHDVVIVLLAWLFLMLFDYY